MHKGLLAGALALAFTGSSAASALTLSVTSAGLYDYSVIHVAGSIAGVGPFDRDEFAGALLLQGTTDKGKPFSIVSYCFDLTHSISVGFGGQSGVAYTFTVEPATTDQIGGPGMGNALSAYQLGKMGSLAVLGANLFAGGTGDLANQMPAIQAAIWTIEYGLTATLANATQQGYYDTYLASPNLLGRATQSLVAKDAQGQVIGFYQGFVPGSGVPGVPEPESWAMLIAGFGIVGAMARRRRSGMAVAA